METTSLEFIENSKEHCLKYCTVDEGIALYYFGLRPTGKAIVFFDED